MKVKLKLDAASIKKWGFEHGEKLAFGIMLLVFLGFTYYAIRREVLDAAKQPENLQAMANEVKTRVANSKWDAKGQNVQLIDFDKRAQRDTVVATAFAMTVPFNAPLIAPKVKREDPALYNVEELRVSGGFGPFALKGEAAGAAAARPGNPPPARGPGHGGRNFRPAAGAKLQGQPWAVVTALVPIEKQRKEYARAFERAVGEVKERDTPHYAGPLVERAEIIDADPNKLDWKPVKDPTVFEAKWDNILPDVVAAEYTDPNLTAPLGPLVGADWDESVAHPKIPLAGAQASPPPAAVVADAQKNKEPEKDAGKPADDTGGAFIRRGSKPLAADAPPEAKVRAAAAGPAGAGYKLLRVFDYSVEANKRYRYRIKLGCDNPNYGVAVQHLKNPETPRPQVRVTNEWSEPTDVVAIPDGNGVLAGGLKPQKTANPTKAKLLLTAIDKENGIEAAIEQEFERGAVANVVGKEVKARDPRTDQVTEPSKIDFKTDTVVLDIYGGRALSKKKDSQLAGYVEVLLLDKNGHLTVRSELDDHSMYEHRKLPEETEASASDKPNAVPGPDPTKPKKPPRQK